MPGTRTSISSSGSCAKGDREAAASLCCMMMRLPNLYAFDVDERTARHLALLCERYGLSENELISRALELAELKLAEFEIRLAVQLEDGPHET